MSSQTSGTATRSVEILPFRVVPGAPGLGAEILGAGLRALGDGDFAMIRHAWIAHQVLLIRGQDLTDPDLIAFSRRLGDLDLAPISENGRSGAVGYPEIHVVSNVIENGTAIGSLGYGEAVWHTDMSYLPEPAMASMLYALEIPPSGGDTSFLDMYAAFEALPAALKQRVMGLRVKHDGTYNSGGFIRKGVTPTGDPREAPGTLHPMVCTHPESGRRMLYLGRRRMAWIEGLELPESEALLNEIWTYATQKQFIWTHRWRIGDLVLWDNRCTMHRRDPFDNATRRVMHRTQIKGIAPPAA